MYWVGLVGAFLFSLGMGIEGVKSNNIRKRVGGGMSLAGAACFLAVIIAKLLGRF